MLRGIGLPDIVITGVIEIRRILSSTPGDAPEQYGQVQSQALVPEVI